jgi:hypothetical protein
LRANVPAAKPKNKSLHLFFENAALESNFCNHLIIKGLYGLITKAAEIAAKKITAFFFDFRKFH